MGADPLQERTPACLKPQSKPRICLILATTVAGCALIFSQMERAIFLRPFAEAQPPRAAQGAASALRTASDTPSSAPAVAARVVSADAPMPAKLRYSWVYLPRGDSRALLRSSMLDLRATNEYSGPIRLAQAVRPDHINGSLQPSQASCAHLCRSHRPTCAGYSWRKTTNPQMAQCFLISQSYGESTACAVEASACDGVLSEDRRVCCAASCGRCGGAGCADLPGGRHSCCASRILSFASCCEENGAPCVVRTHRALYLGEHSPHKRGRRRMRRPQPVTTPCKALNASAVSPEAEAESVEARVQTHARSSGVRFLLATPSARVGSNWLRTMLEQHPQVFMEGEILSSTSYLRRRLEFPNNSVAAVDAAFESARLAALAQQKRVFGFKSGGPGMGLVCGCSDIDLIRQARARHDARIIYLFRRDPVAIALSIEYARHSKVYVASNQSMVPFGFRITLQVDSFVALAKWHAAHSLRYSNLLRAAVPDGYLTISYEELMISPARVLATTFDYLGVQDCRIDESETTHKIMRGGLEKHVHNWQELCLGLDQAGLQTEIWRLSCAK